MATIPKKSSEWIRLGDAIQSALSNLSPPDDIHLSLIVSEWEKCVGDSIAGQATPVRYENGCLTVYVANHIWLNELRSGLGRTLEKKLKADKNLKIKRVIWTARSSDSLDISE